MKPVVAAVLNFFTLGLGYLFLTRKKVFGLIMFLGAVPACILEFSLEQGSRLWLYSFSSFFLLAVATAIDGFAEAKAAQATAAPAMAKAA